jgi:hypothetical protein
MLFDWAVVSAILDKESLHGSRPNTLGGIWGSTAECVDKLAVLVQAGAQHLLLNPMFDDLEHLELLAQEIIPHL